MRTSRSYVTCTSGEAGDEKKTIVFKGTVENNSVTARGLRGGRLHVGYDNNTNLMDSFPFILDATRNGERHKRTQKKYEINNHEMLT